MTMQNEKFKREFIQRLINFSIEIIKLSDLLRKNKSPYSIIDQLIRSATSVGANVVEAKSAHSKRDYIKFFEIALKSANETKYWLIIIKEAKFINNNIDNHLKENIEIANIIATSIMTMKKRK